MLTRLNGQLKLVMHCDVWDTATEPARRAPLQAWTWVAPLSADRPNAADLKFPTARAGGSQQVAMAPTSKPVTLITGASAGIGLALARLFAERGHECALVARRETRLNALADEIAKAGRPRPHVLAIDLGTPDAGERVAKGLADHGLEPAIVVNNAGFGLRGDAADLDRGEQLAMIDLNARALTDLSLRFVASLKRHAGGLINIASLSPISFCSAFATADRSNFSTTLAAARGVYFSTVKACGTSCPRIRSTTARAIRRARFRWRSILRLAAGWPLRAGCVTWPAQASRFATRPSRAG